MPDSIDLPHLTREIAAAMPVVPVDLVLGREKVGLVIVDEVNGFATVGAGNLAPPAPNAQVSTMVAETDRLARAFTAKDWKILAFLDTHVPGKAEPPYPPHCEAGTGEEELVPELAWLEQDANTTLVRKDCINGFVGAIRPDGSNAVVDWVNAGDLQRLLVVGICTDICVMDFVLTLLSARNHDLMPSLKDISVYADGCSTYDLPLSVAESLGLPGTAAHPQDLSHHMGLYFMASRGAEIVGKVTMDT
ncbi:isochorismatase family protein [Pelagibius litoralis]|uniref:Isochorismatase family protein n=1 Tax=Pelagibius litoralis TaxID=374515 RepID=A0A967C5E0_9PROT|nr:isochorismatase family protein [Pelagibius litoralis]NIA67736.1 isochorismatase family protein [Pelagibius litoralis]